MDRIGKYEILGEIGAGGFGKVYRGRDPILKRTVAIKTCSSDDPTLRQRFRREAEIVAALQHPNITTIHDLGEQDSIPYLVQELLDGEDLSQVIGRRDQLSVEQKARILHDVARAIEHAHGQGIIHRDIKPGNIRVLANGTIKVMDFGIAKIGDVQTELTRTGMMLGTGPYLAPEQLTDTPVDSRCDIFSYGVVAYELFAYQRPFEASNFSSLLYKILHQPHTPVRELCPDLPPALVELVERCLIKDRDRRIGSFTEIRAQLAALLNISEERDLSFSRSRAFVDATVAYDSGPVSRQVPDHDETILLQSGEALTPAAGTPATGAATSGATATVATAVPISAATVQTATPAPAGGGRSTAIIAAAILLVGVGIVATMWLRTGAPAPPEVSAPANAAAPGPVNGGAALPSATPQGESGAPGEAAAAEVPEPSTGAPPAPTEREGRTGPATTSPRSTTEPAPDAVEREANRPRVEPAAPAANEPRASPSRTEPEVATVQQGASTAEDEPVRSAAAPSSAPEGEAPPPRDANPAERPAQDAAPPALEAGPSSAVTPAPASPARTEPATPPEPARPDPAIEEAAVRAALDRYRRAYEALDIDALAAAWPSLDGEARTRIGRSFAGYQSLAMTLDDCRIALQGATATASCSVHQEVTPKGGRRLTSDLEVEFQLEKRGDAWVIRGR
jgi:hypothetical protein